MNCWKGLILCGAYAVAVDTKWQNFGTLPKGILKFYGEVFAALLLESLISFAQWT
jgi:hypothetical protein